jgi:hypothetical protein
MVPYRRSLHLDNLVAQGEVDEIAQGAKIQLPHETRSMSFYSSYADIESNRNLPVRFAFRQQLQDLLLPRRESGRARTGFRAFGWPVLRMIVFDAAHNSLAE